MTRTLARVLCVVAALVCGAIGLVVAPSPAYACECARRSTTQALRDADAVFRGTVTDRDRVRDGQDVRVDFRLRVDAVYKGTAYADQVVASAVDGASCGLDPAVGTTWVIFATEAVEGSGNRAVNRLVTNLCSGNLRTDQGPALLGPPQVPRPGSSDREEKAVNLDAAVTRMLLIGGVVVGVLAAGAAVALGLLWRPGRRRP